MAIIVFLRYGLGADSVASPFRLILAAAVEPLVLYNSFTKLLVRTTNAVHSTMTTTVRLIASTPGQARTVENTSGVFVLITNQMEGKERSNRVST